MTPGLLIIRHVPWEGPHRVAQAFRSIPHRIVEPLRAEPLPAHADIAGVVVMGGPMNVDETDRYPALAAEREWLKEAVHDDVPILGICLGAQLLARALGAEVGPGERPEIGFAPIEVLDPSDPIVGCLAPRATVLHWHGDVFELPVGAQPLASSELTEHQAFRIGNAWGLLFHPEADSSLVDAWLSVPEMAAEATHAIGADAPQTLRAEARSFEADLVCRSTPGSTSSPDWSSRGSKRQLLLMGCGNT
jgi:GMP synthase (glutamine-hydrolysing)